ncbi:hypothetical protein EDEG_03986 [Edhazardia aedis USNM 41457]|uniref:Uncharacterized protein n=1 Tax=Edhazardia aedis (strain USNM 41457) TaxID=1003232 RepID=J9DJ27_EDHAE|nr:hypothetical protein EDEG_03986 [Edhazardia aedis USNM 41457]|eukprot:EJW01392.1 hypothetical protein EDEG_03986 [Edhazardia aedis USNM 41457]
MSTWNTNYFETASSCQILSTKILIKFHFNSSPYMTLKKYYEKKMLKTKITNIISSISLGFIFCLTDSITYGSNILNCDKKFNSMKNQIECVSIVLYLTATLLSQMVFSIFTKIESGFSQHL